MVLAAQQCGHNAGTDERHPREVDLNAAIAAALEPAGHLAEIGREMRLIGEVVFTGSVATYRVGLIAGRLE
jgi:hypothetical protein